LLVGDNGSGKTSVLDALTILLECWVRGIDRVDKGGGISPAYIRAVPRVHQDSTSFERQLPVRIEAAGFVQGIQLNWARQRNHERGGTSYMEAKVMGDAAQRAAIAVRDGSPVVLPLIESYGAERLWTESPTRAPRRKSENKNDKPSRLDGYKDCLDFGIQETILVDWIRAQVLDGFQLGKKTIALKVAERAITACIEGGKALIYSEREKELAFELDTVGWQLLPNLSAGQRIMATMIGELARRAACLNPDLGTEVLEKTPGVVLIDELDLHLHPRWQRRIIHDLKRTFPLVQFIATTHSPQLIGEALPNEIRILSDGKSYSAHHSLGLDSSRVLEEIQGASRRSSEAEALIHRIALAIDEEKFDDAKGLIVDLEKMVGPEDAEVTRPRSLLKFMEAPQ
jgi:predicted ATP-binding protein involved in virulence